MHRSLPLALAVCLALSVVSLVMLKTADEILDGLPIPDTPNVKDHEMQFISRTAPGGHEVRVLRPEGMSIADFLRVFVGQAAVPPKKETWVSGGDTYMVVTPTQPGEDPQDWCDRHDDLVEAAKKLLPPDE